MLTQLRLQNFQCHADLTIPLKSPITYITGPNDSGKSAILRALRWVLFNKPDGVAFVREGQEVARVELAFDGMSLVRVRGKDGTPNTYDLTGFTTASAFGRSVPDPIVQALKVGPLNFQSQHDAPFWVALSPADLSRELNQLVDLQVMDDSLGYLNRASRACQSDTKHLQSEIANKRQALGALHWVAPAAEALSALESLHKSATVRRGIVRDVQRLVDEAQALKTSLEDSLQLIQAGSRVLEAGEAYQKVAARATRLRHLLEQRMSLRPLAAKPVPDITPLAGLRNSHQNSEARADRLRLLLSKWNEGKRRLQEADAQLQQAQSRLKEIPLCPTCQRPEDGNDQQHKRHCNPVR